MAWACGGLHEPFSIESESGKLHMSWRGCPVHQMAVVLVLDLDTLVSGTAGSVGQVQFDEIESHDLLILV